MRWIYLLAGHFFLGLGVIGLVLPIVPTTPFLLLAAFFYSRGSKKFYNWLIQHPKFGPLVLDWNQHRVIRPRAKALATVMILASFSVPLFVIPLSLIIRGVLLAVEVTLLVFIWTRNSRPQTLEEVAIAAE